MIQDAKLESAIWFLKSNTNAITDVEEVNILEAVGRVAAEDIFAKFDNPPFDRSPLDGYAINSLQTPGKFKIIAEECAGDFFDGELKSNEALRIMTGAAMPKGSDCVIRQEDVEVIGEELIVPYHLKHHENYCFAGEDIKKEALIIEAGKILNAASIAILASQGFNKIKVKRQPKIIIASTGDELIMPGSELTPGKIYNSNLYFMAARLKELGFNVNILCILKDDTQSIVDTINQYKNNADLFITTGGVSVGKKDIMHEVVNKVGKKLFWRVNMKPGAPVIGYKAGNMLGIALSGNPFAAYATFELLVRPVLAKLSGMANIMYKRSEAILRSDFSKESKGRRFIRAHYENNEVTLPEQHSSGSLFSMVNCNSLVDIPAGTGKLTKGMKVEVVIL